MRISRLAGALLIPIAVFGILYALVVRPQRAIAHMAQQRLEQAKAQLAVAQARERGSGGAATAADVEAVLKGPRVGEVTNLSIRKDPGALTLTFDARHDQIARFFWALPTLPAVEVNSAELAPASEGAVRVTVGLRVNEQDRPAPASLAEPGSEPRWSRNPFKQPSVKSPAAARHRVGAPLPEADPVVSGIFVSEGRRLAVVDGRIVGPGDVLGTTIVRSIEPEAVIIAGPDGRSRRLAIRRPPPVPAGPM